VYWENVVWDALEPRRLGRFWEKLLGSSTLTDELDVYETRLLLVGGPPLDLCFQRVPEPPSEPVRLHLDLAGGPEQQVVAARALELGARHLDIGQGDVPWVVLADPEGNPLCVMEERPAYVDTGPVAAIPVDSADPGRDRAFWAWLTGWTPVPGAGLASLRHPARRGPLLEFAPEPASKPDAKNRLHLDVRLEADDDVGAVVRGIEERGGRELHPDWGELPWRVFADPSGNEFCVLPARGHDS
jgi:hypothetical protein